MFYISFEKRIHNITFNKMKFPSIYIRLMVFCLYYIMYYARAEILINYLNYISTNKTSELR